MFICTQTFTNTLYKGMLSVLVLDFTKPQIPVCDPGFNPVSVYCVFSELAYFMLFAGRLTLVCILNFSIRGSSAGLI